jgi:hypothetical protein
VFFVMVFCGDVVVFCGDFVVFWVVAFRARKFVTFLNLFLRLLGVVPGSGVCSLRELVDCLGVRCQVSGVRCQVSSIRFLIDSLRFVRGG